MDNPVTNVPKWCKDDKHHHYELFSDFNDWIDDREGESFPPLLQSLLDSGLPNVSKAFYAADREAYTQAFNSFQQERGDEVLSKDRFLEYLGDTDGKHWFERNTQRLTQLVTQLTKRSVVPFIGAGVSVSGGFPTWKEHLRQQGRTAGIDPDIVDNWLDDNQYEEVIDQVEKKTGPATFAQEIRDVFGRTGKLENIILRIADLFDDTIITTNYDHLLEQAYDGKPVQVITDHKAQEDPDADKTTIIKLHGDANTPGKCILGKAHYDAAYGHSTIDLSKAIPRMLKYYYSNSSLLFIGCSLNDDRTLQVFSEVKSANIELEFPQHFAIVSAPTTHEAMADRSARLLALGITPIWYPDKDRDKVEAILRHAQNEVNRMDAQILK